MDHRRVHVAVGPGPVAGEALLQGQVEDDRHGGQVGRCRRAEEFAPRPRLDARRVDDGEIAGTEPIRERPVEGTERAPARPLVILAAADAAPELVGGEDLRGGEPAPGERRLARPGRPDEDDEARVGEEDPAVGPTRAARVVQACDRRPSQPCSPRRIS